MPTAVTAIFGADGTPLQAELRRIEVMAANAGRRITSNVAGESRMGIARVVQEMTVIGREIAMGRGMGRIVGSGTLLYQFLRNLAKNAKDASGPARAVAEAYDAMALSAANAAKAAIRKAQASEMAFYADAEESEATLNAAIADRAKAAAAEQAAIATQQKAIASSEAAAAAEGEAAATVALGAATSVLTVGLAAVLVTAGFIYEKFWGFAAALKAAAMETPDLKDNDYIPLLKRHLSDARNAQKEVTDEVQKTVQAYYSAASAAQRSADAAKEHYGHLRKMNELHKEAELSRTHSESQKKAIEKKYSDLDLQLQRSEHVEEIASLRGEKSNLEHEAQIGLDKSNNIKVATREEDQKTLSELNTNAEAAQAFLKGGGVWAQFKKQAAADLGGSPMQIAARKAAIAAAEQGGAETANNMIAQRDKFANQMAANDELRKTKDDLVKGAAKSASEAAKIGESLPGLISKNNTAEQNAAEEEQARLAIASKHHQERGFGINSAQRLGAYAATPPDFKKLVDAAMETARNTSHLKPQSNRPVGAHPPSFGAHSHR